MVLLVAWAVQPVMLAALCAGCGLLVERAWRSRLRPALVLATGFGVVVVAGSFATLSDATAELAAPLVVGLAVAGLVAGRGERPRLDGWAIAAVLGAYAVFAAPIVLSGEATFAGYIRLDDTATWMALTDRVMEHGRSIEGLGPSSYEATLAFNLGAGYPIGAFLPLGVAHDLLGTDVAWLIQPYMAFMAALLAAVLWTLSEPLDLPRPLRAAAAFLAAQSALLVGYYLWGGVKEVATATLIAAAAGLGARCVWERFSPSSLVPLAVVGAALLAVIAGGALLWLAPLLAAMLGFALGLVGWRAAARRAAWLVALTALLAIPALSAGLRPPTSASLTSETAQGNLLHPLEVWRLAGVWPAGDFRLDPASVPATAALIAAIAVAAAIGLGLAWQRRAWPVALYVGATLLAGLGIFIVGSPWVGGKALATASPAVPFAAALGAALLWSTGKRVAGALLLAALAAGVLWSNALAYREVNLAPRDQLAELEAIGERIAGEGPTLMTEYQPYGVRHFLRDAQPEGASELRRHEIPLLDGSVLPKGTTADTDRFRLGPLTAFRTLVLRRSPAQSRPPSQYRLTWRGDYYEVWQRPAGTAGAVLAHLGLGTATDPGGRARCSDIQRLARRAGPRGSLAAVPRDAPSLARLPRGASSARVRVRTPGAYEIWLRGSVRPEVTTTVDGERVGSVRHQLENAGEYVRLGEATLAAGPHGVEVDFGGADLHPGSGGEAPPAGPVVLSSQDAAATRALRFPPEEARRLCGRRWDWIEALR